MPEASPSFTDRLAVFAATLGPVGRMPKAPGTWGSATALVAAPWCLMPLPLSGRIAALGVVFAGGAWAAGRAERALGRKDPGCVVVDELLGQWAAFTPFHLGADALFTPQNPFMPVDLLLLFLLFRLFDILKPWPIRALDRGVPGGLGIMVDDLAAGLFAAASFAILRAALSAIWPL